MVIYSLLFYSFSFFAVIAALMVIFSKNPVHSVLWLILTFFSIAGCFVLIGAEFIAMSLIIVYVGAVAVLFLFVVMMLNISKENLKKSFFEYLPILLLLSIVLFVDLYLVLNNTDFNKSNIIANPIPNSNEVTNAHAIGQILYTNYFVEFQLAGFILLVAMIGAIVLTNRSRANVKKQDIYKQVNRDPLKSIIMTKPKIGRGIDGNI